MTTKINTLAKLGCLALLLLTRGRAALAADLTDQQVMQALTTEQPRDKAIRRGLEFLHHAQRPDGMFGEKYPTALSSMAVMAHFASGITLEDRQDGAMLRRTVNAILAKQDENGYFGSKDDSKMYGHGITTLMLAEALGMTSDDELEERIRRALTRAVQVTVNAAQVKKNPENEGGWRYSPTADDSDLSLSGWQLMSLHAVQQVGIPVPDKVIKRAVSYTKRLITTDGKVGYTKRDEDRPALRGLALLCLAIGGEENSAEAVAVTKQIVADPIKWDGKYLLYRAYYDAVGLSRSAPEVWLDYAPKLEKLLLEHQEADGSWNSPGPEVEKAGNVYTTCMAIMSLTVQRHVLPAYQR